MTALNRMYVVVLAFSMIVMIPRLHANEEELDEYWQQRAKEAEMYAKAAYNPNPEEITGGFTKEIAESLSYKGRSLQMKNKGGPCEATNPIDQCWRCRPDWETNRFRLADCVKGFGHKTTGGKGGKIYVVTNPADDSTNNPTPGTLRYGVIQDGPLWITFARPMHINLKQELMINSNKTIDARGANIHIAYGCGLTLHYVENVIIHGLHIHDIKEAYGGFIRDSTTHAGWRTKSDGDGINIFGSSNIWIDHVSMQNCKDGLIDAIMGSTAITISNCHFTKHNDVMLFGASENHLEDKQMQITVAFNHFGKGLVQRMPRCRYGFIHVVNNDYTHWLKYAIGGSQHPTIISQGNRYIAQDDNQIKEVTHRDYASEAEWKTWTWISEKDLFINGAFFKSAGGQLQSHNYTKEQYIDAMPGTMVGHLTKHAGPIKCIKKQPC